MRDDVIYHGSYEDLSAKILNYLHQFLYHIHIYAGKQFLIGMEKDVEVAAFLPAQYAIINGTAFNTGEFVEFDREEETIEISNPSDICTDILLFGGETNTESVVAEGPFVLNISAEIVLHSWL